MSFAGHVFDMIYRTKQNEYFKKYRRVRFRKVKIRQEKISDECYC